MNGRHVGRHGLAMTTTDLFESPRTLAAQQTSSAAVRPASARRSGDETGTAAADGDGDIEAPPTASAGRRRKRRWLWLCAVLAVASGIAAALAVVAGRGSDTVEAVLLDEPAPALSGPTLDGPPLSIADHRGDVVVVNVWASWCTVCKDEHPELEAAARKLAPSGVRFIGLDTMDTVEDARAFLDEMGGSSYPSVLDPDGRKARDWSVFGVPTTFLVDQRGRVRVKAVGAVTEQWLITSVGDLLPEGQPER